MQSDSENENQLEPGPPTVRPSAVFSEPWWRSTGYNPNPAVIGGHINDGMGSKDGKSQRDGDVVKEFQSNVALPAEGNYGQVHQNLQLAASTLPGGDDESLAQPSQLELVGHSIACAPNPYPDPYYAGMMAAYGPQPLVHPHLLGMHYPRMPLPIDMEQEPVYVNAKQYHGIMRRRQSRAKAESEKKLIKARKPYLHESRHQHAMRRVRGTGGRFAKKVNPDASNPLARIKGRGSGSAHSSQSASSSGSDRFPSNSVETQKISKCSREETGHRTQKTSDTQTRGGCYQNNMGFQESVYSSDLGEREDEADSSGQQWGSIRSNQTRQRALTIQ